MVKTYRSFTCFTVILCFAFSNAGTGCSQEFDGGGDGVSWDDAMNWSNGDVPDSVNEDAEVSVSGIGAPWTVVGGAPIVAADIYLSGMSTLTANSTVDAAGGITVEGATFSVNASVTTGSFEGLTIMSGGVVNLNSGVISGNLNVGSFFDTTASHLNRNGGSLAVEELVARGVSSVEVVSGDSVSGGIASVDGGTVTVNTPVNLADYLQLGDATLNLNENVVAEEFFLHGNSTLNRAAGTALSVGGLSLTDSNYVSTSIDDISGSIDMSGSSNLIVNHVLDISGVGGRGASKATLNSQADIGGVSFSGSGSVLNVNATLNTQFGIDIENGATLNVAGDITDGGGFGVDVRSGTLNLSSGTIEGTLGLSQSSFNRSGGSLNLENLSVSGGSALRVTSADGVSQSLFVGDGAEVTIDAFLDVAEVVSVSDATLILNENLAADELLIGGVSTVRRNGNSIELESLSIEGASIFGLQAGDSVDSARLTDQGKLVSAEGLSFVDGVFLSDDSEFYFTQELASTTGVSASGLSVSDNAILSLEFDQHNGDGLDWAFRVDGDQQSLLQALIDSNSIQWSGGIAPIGLIYDSVTYGDFTYIGYVATAIPEPSATLPLLFSFVALRIRRRRFE